AGERSEDRSGRLRRARRSWRRGGGSDRAAPAREVFRQDARAETRRARIRPGGVADRAPAEPWSLPVIRRVLPVPRRLDLIVLGCAISLSVLGILFVSSTTQGGRFEGLATRQAVWVLVG